MSVLVLYLTCHNNAVYEVDVDNAKVRWASSTQDVNEQPWLDLTGCSDPQTGATFTFSYSDPLDPRHVGSRVSGVITSIREEYHVATKSKVR